MGKRVMIHKEDAPLLIDVQCYRCKRLVAMSNTYEIDGRRYCERCVEVMEQMADDVTDYKNERLAGL